MSKENKNAPVKEALTLDQRKAIAAAGKRKYNILAFVLIIALIAAAVPINMFASRLDISWDMTPNSYYSLSDTTLNVLDNLHQDINIDVLIEMESLEQDSQLLVLAKILQEFDKSEHITLRTFDLEENPQLAAEINPDGVYYLSEGDLVIHSGEMSKKISGTTLFSIDSETSEYLFNGENYITGAIQYCITGEVPQICFLTGHGERTLEDNFTALSNMLAANNYRVSSLNLASSDIPDDCRIITIAAPQQDITDYEYTKLTHFLNDGGALSVLLPPNSGSFEYTNLARLLKEYGLGINYDQIYETGVDNYASDDPYAILAEVAKTEYSELTTPLLDTGYDAFFPDSRSIFRYNSSNKELTVELLLSSSSEGTAVSQPCGGVAIDTNEESGVHYLALNSVDEARNSSKIVLYGSCDFIDDEYINSTLVEVPVLLYFSATTWLYNNNVDMQIAAKSQSFDSMDFSSGESAANTVLGIIAAVPILVAIAGLLIWVRRRNS